MRRFGRISTTLLLGLVATACATARQPLTDVPAGEYVLVEPETDVYNAVRINDRMFTVRMDDAVHSGEHWVDGQGRLHMADTEGPCAGVESIWTYSYSANRVTLNLVEDRCSARSPALPDRMVYQRR